MSKLTDRELDAYLAEHLLDWYYDISPRGGPYPPQMVFAQNAEQAGRRTSGSTFAPPLSSTGDGMLLVIEAMRGRGWDWEMHAYSNPAMRGMRFTAGASSPAVPSPLAWWADASSLPRAVAEAARAAWEARA